MNRFSDTSTLHIFKDHISYKLRSTYECWKQDMQESVPDNT